MEQQAPKFLVRKGHIHRSIGQALVAIWETDPQVQSIGLHCTRAWPKNHSSVPGLFSSFLLHFSLVLLLVRLPVSSFLVQPSKAREHRTDQVVYVLHPLNLADYFPTLKPGGPGGKPGQGNRPELPPARGGTIFHPKLTIISNPPHPDNNRQTIRQPSSPPELKIPYELRLPNILIGKVPPPPAQRPAPPVAPKPSAIEIPVARPTLAPAPLPSAPALALVPLPNPFLHSALPVSPPPPPAPPTQSSSAREATTSDEQNKQATPSEGAGLLSLSVAPASSAESMALPPGNRQGAFSISPEGGKEGSPGGVPTGDARGGGSGGNGAGGDASMGLGPGDKGGGGGSSVVATSVAGESVSISGGPNGNKDGVLPSFYAATMVYPVAPPAPRHPGMVVTAGPSGGGGLQVYGVLKGGKIYTIYLPMPGKNWILQYCPHDSSAASQVRQSHSVELRLDPGIVPPSAVEQFDFYRPPVSKSYTDRKEMIILQGVIREDGSVGELKVLQGLHETVDQAALAAFSRWKFRPAQRSTKPIAVEILVGIPVILPVT